VQTEIQKKTKSSKTSPPNPQHGQNTPPPTHYPEYQIILFAEIKIGILF